MQMQQRGVYANIMFDLYANVHIIMEMYNVTFRFAGLFVESQNTNFARLLHLQTRTFPSLRPYRCIVRPLMARCQEITFTSLDF